MAEQLSQEWLEFIRPFLEPVEFVPRNAAGRTVECACGCQGACGLGAGHTVGKFAEDLLLAQRTTKAESKKR